MTADDNEDDDLDLSYRDNSFRQFRRLCEDLEKEPSYNSKTKLVSNYLQYGNTGSEEMSLEFNENENASRVQWEENESRIQ